MAIRYPRGKEDIEFKYSDSDYSVFSNEGKIAIVTYGIISSNAIKALKQLNNDGINVDVIKLNKIYPVSEKLINKLQEYEKVYFFEEGIRKGGISEHIVSRGKFNYYRITAIDNSFVPSSSVTAAREKLGLDPISMYKIIKGEN